MAFIPATNCLKVSIKWKLGGQELRSVLYFHKASSWAEGDITSFASALDGAIVSSWLDHLHVDLTYTGFDIVDISAANNPIGQVVKSAPPAGAHATGACFTGQDCVVLTKRTAKSGRSFRGRLFVPGIPVEKQEGLNTVTAAFIGQLLTDFAGLIADGLVTGVFHVVLSLFSGMDSNHVPIPRSLGLPTVVTALSADQSIDSQNRRLEGRGN